MRRYILYPIVLLFFVLAGCTPTSLSGLDETLSARTSPFPRLQRSPVATSTLATSESAKPTSKPSPTPTPIPTSSLGVETSSLSGQQVQFWHPWQGKTEAAIQELVEQFNSENDWGIQVQARSKGSLDNLDASLQTAIQEGEQPDLAVAYLYQALGWKEKPIDLGEYLDDPDWGFSTADETDFYPVFWEQARQGEQMLGLPAFASAQVLYYNQTWAQELGFDAPPATTEELKEQVCAAAQANLKDEDTTNDGSGGLLLTSNYSAMLGWMKAFGAQIMQADAREADNPYQFNTPEVVDTFTFLRKLHDQGCASLIEEGDPQEEFTARRALLVEGSVASMPDQIAAMKRSNNDDRWTALPFPSPDQQAVLPVYGPSIVMLESEPEGQLAAWLFLRFLFNPENQARLTQASGGLPLRAASLPLLQAYRESFPQWSAAVEALPLAQPEPADYSWRLVRWAISDATTQLFRSYFNVDQTADLAKFLNTTAADLYADLR